VRVAGVMLIVYRMDSTIVVIMLSSEKHL